MTRPWRSLVPAVALVGLLLAAGCSDGETADYDDEFRDDFLQQCSETYAAPEGAQVCGCWYDTISEAVPFEDLPDVDDLLGDDLDTAASRVPGSDLELPMRTLAECVRTLGVSPTIGTAVPLPTLPRPPTTPTTATTVVG
jgi:hypothetical protein